MNSRNCAIEKFVLTYKKVWLIGSRTNINDYFFIRYLRASEACQSVISTYLGSASIYVTMINERLIKLKSLSFQESQEERQQCLRYVLSEGHPGVQGSLRHHGRRQGQLNLLQNFNFLEIAFVNYVTHFFIVCHPLFRCHAFIQQKSVFNLFCLAVPLIRGITIRLQPQNK